MLNLAKHKRSGVGRSPGAVITSEAPVSLVGSVVETHLTGTNLCTRSPF